MLTRLLQHRIDPGKVELALDGLDLLPSYRDLERVRVELANDRPNVGQHGRIVAAVVGLCAKDQKGRAIHEERVLSGTFDQSGRGAACAFTPMTESKAPTKSACKRFMILPSAVCIAVW